MWVYSCTGIIILMRSMSTCDKIESFERSPMISAFWICSIDKLMVVCEMLYFTCDARLNWI